MRLSTSLNLLFGIGTIQNQMERIVSCGFRYLDMNFTDWSFNMDSPFVADDWEDWVHGIGEFAKGHGISFNQAHGPIYNVLAEGDMKGHLDKMSIRSVKAAAILKIPHIVFHAGSWPGDFKKAHIDGMKNANMMHFDTLVQMCHQLDTGLAFENMADSFRTADGGLYCSRTDDLLDLVDSFKSPRVSVCWDTGHANVQKTNQKSDIIKIGSRLKALHIQDNDGIHDSHRAPFYGNINWPEIMEALKEAQYEGCFTFEAHMHVRNLPDPLKDDAIKILYKIGKHLINI